jgi:hypothetical protein
MQPPPYEETRRRALTTDDEIEQRVRALVGRAQHREIWLLFLEPNNVQSPVVLPFSEPPLMPVIGDMPVWSRIIDEVVEACDARGVILVIERYGPPGFTEADRAWARFIAGSCGESAVPLRAVLLSHRRGVRTVPPDDYVG